MIIDCHGHYTTAPKRLQDVPRAPDRRAERPVAARPPRPACISDDEIRESIEGAQLKLQNERGTDLTIFSPRAAGMAHHLGDAATSAHWSRACNDLIHRVCTLFPENFVGVCQLPQIAGRVARQLHRRARALRQGAGLHRLQPQSRSVGRLLDATRR